MIKFGAAAVHIEDQVGAKRCGHRPARSSFARRDGRPDQSRRRCRTDPDFVIMARTDALAVEGLPAAIDRGRAYVAAGADMIFPEAITELAMYQPFAAAVKVPILANITEFGATPLFTLDELRNADVAIALYPLSAFRAMNKAASPSTRRCAATARRRAAVDAMQTRAELYDYLDYHAYEHKLDAVVRREDMTAGELLPIHGESDERSNRSAPKAEEIGRAFGCCGRQHRALHRRPHRQRSCLPRLRHPRHRAKRASSRKSRTC
jgi:methylisocitrate lyase